MSDLAITNSFDAGDAIVASQMNTNFTDVTTWANNAPNIGASGQTTTMDGALTVTEALIASSTSQFNGAITVGIDDTGHNVKLFGATTGDYLLWDQANNKLVIEGANGTTALDVTDGNVVVEDTVTAATFVGALTGNVTGNVSGSSGSTTGNAATATALETARTIGGVSFNGTGNINLPGVNTAGNQDTSGTAADATVLETARTINGVSFNGSANITVTAAAGTLTGSTLNSGVTASSLTSVGTLASATITGDLTVDTSTLKVDATNNRVGVNTATPSYNLDVYGNGGTGYVARIMAAAGTENMLIIRAGAASPSTNFAQFLDSGDVEHGEIVGYGVGVQFNSASDRRLKHSITDLNMGLETVRALQPRSFLMLGSENLGTQAGFIADEVETVVPTVVSGEKDAVEVVPATDNESEYERVRPQKLNMTGLVPHVVAAIKELDSRLAAIEAA